MVLAPDSASDGGYVLVTRNPKNFAETPVALRSAGEVLAALGQVSRRRRRD